MPPKRTWRAFLAAVTEASQPYPQYRMRRALLLIGPTCHTYTTGIGSCWDSGRTPDAQYTADRWCDGCIAAWGLGLRRAGTVRRGA